MPERIRKAPISDNNHGDQIDYSEMYRKQEIKQLNKRLKKTRNILLFSAIALVAGAGLFWVMPEKSFTLKNFLAYLALAFILILFAINSKKHPYFSILTSLILCIGFWGIEILILNSDDLLIEGSILKLVIISLLVSSFHSSKEAELIRKELHFS